MAAAAQDTESQLIRAVGLFALTAAIINVVIGGGIFRLPSSIAANMGAAAPMAFIMGALAIILCGEHVGRFGADLVKIIVPRPRPLGPPPAIIVGRVGGDAMPRP